MRSIRRVLLASLAIAPIVSGAPDVSGAPGAPRSVRSAAAPTHRTRTASATLGGSIDGLLVTSDSCAAPTILSGTGTFFFDNRNASTDGLAHSTCNFSGSAQVYKDLWIHWIAACDGLATISVCGLTSLDTKIAVYAPGAPCPPSSEFVVACNDDACGVQSRVQFLAIAGQEYTFRLGQFNASSPGSFGQCAILCDAGAGVCHYDDCQPSSSMDAYFSENATGRVADDFVAGSSGAISGVCWWGVYVDVNDTDPDQFRITYYEDAGGRPGRPIAVFYQGYDFALRGPVDTGRLIAGQLPEYGYSASHAPIAVGRNARYWIEIVNDMGEQSWAWSDSVEGESMQDDTPHDTYANTTIPPIPGRAFCLGFSSACPVDTNGDGVINFADLNKILSAFGSACP